MSTLTLVRHGQAGPFQRENAPLTVLGETQAAKLAQFWLHSKTEFDEVYSGTLARQVRTEQIVAKSFHAAGRHWPSPVRDAAWNEYDATGVLRQSAEFELPGESPDEHRKFQRMFEAAMTRWLEGAIEADGVESWPLFRDRVSDAIQRLMAGPPGRRVAVFTSGGPIGFTVHSSLQAPAKAFLDVNWRVRNTSITQFIFDRSRVTLDCFNTFPHLAEGSLWTYR